MQRTIQTFEYFQRGAESANSLLLVSAGAALKRIFGAVWCILYTCCIQEPDGLYVVYKSQTEVGLLLAAVHSETAPVEEEKIRSLSPLSVQLE